MARSIRQNIILSFSIFSLVSLILVGIISVVFVGFIGFTTVNRSTNALEMQIQDNINQTAISNSQIINKKLMIFLIHLRRKEVSACPDRKSGY